MFLSGAGLLAGFTALLFILLDQGLGFLCENKISIDEICTLVGDIKIRILFLAGGFLFLYGFSTWLILSRLSRPIQKITDHILSYTEKGLFPLIELDSVQKGEVAKIAAILNAMIGKIKIQFDNLQLSRMETVEILESLGEGVVAVDTSGVATFVNESACKILGASREAILAGPLHQIEAAQKDLAVKCYEAIQDVLQTSEPIRHDWQCKNGGKTHLELSAAPRPGHRGAILLLQDKSSDFRVLEMGKDFIANASHELKTPITIIQGFAETLQDHPELSPEMFREILDKIVRTSHRLGNLVKSLLTLADIENFSQESVQSIDLVAIAKNCSELCGAHANLQIGFESDLDRALVYGDPQLLDLALMNLLENAVKYSPSPAEISLSIRKKDPYVQLIVQDKGIGIPEPDLPHIFDRFYTVDKARSRKSGGAGLGLSIVKTIVEKHRGRVLGDSKPGLGSVFTISLPLKKVS